MMQSDDRDPPIANTKIRYLIQKKNTANTGKKCKAHFTISFSKHDVVKVIKNLIKMQVKLMGN